MVLADAITPQNVQLLSDVTGARFTNAQLRSALIKAGGDLNAAASRLLAAAPSSPIRLPKPRTQHEINRRISEQAVRQAQPQANRERPVKQKVSLPQWALQPASAGAQKGKDNAKDNSKNSAKASADSKRQAWRCFYLEKYQAVATEVGADNKKAIDAEIAQRWKKLGRTGRQNYIQAMVDGEKTDPPQTNANANQAANPAPSGTKCELDVAPVKQQPYTVATSVKTPARKTATSAKVSAPLSVSATLRGSGTDEVPANVTAPLAPNLGTDGVSWPRKISCRLCCARALVQGKNLFKPNDVLDLWSPQPKEVKRGKIVTQKVVRISKDRLDVGRLDPDVGQTLGLAMQTGFVEATGKVVEAPKLIKMCTQIVVEVNIFITQDAFELAKKVDVGKDDTNASGIAVLNMLNALEICDPEGAKTKSQDETEAANAQHSDELLSSVVQVEDDDAKSYVPPASLACTLRGYQRAGVQWMVEREEKGNQARLGGSSPEATNPHWKRKVFMDRGSFYINITTGQLSLTGPSSTGGGPYGGILADEMGLGKTVQCIACILHDFEQMEAKYGSRKRAKAQPSKRERSVSRDRKSPLIQSNDVQMDSRDGGDRNGQAFQPDSEETLNCKVKHTESESTQRTLSVNIQGSLGPDAEDAATFDDDGLPPKEHAITPYMRERPTRKRKRVSMKEDSQATKSSKSNSGSDEEWFESPPQKKRSPVRTLTPAVKRQSSNGPDVNSVLMAKAKSSSPNQGGTLIVCPTSLLAQWMSELNCHVKPNTLRTVAHYGSTRGNHRSISCSFADVVVTSYGVLASEFPNDDNGDNGDNGESEVDIRGGPIFQINWRRVILDEAHMIKSRVTRWAKASFHLKAERRWCVTGTVIHNHVNDAFSMLRFLQFDPWGVWAVWKREVANVLESKDIPSKMKAMSVVRGILAAITLRRTKKTKDSNGNSIVLMTKKTVQTVMLKSSPEEREFYGALEKRTQLKFGNFLAQGNVMKNYASILELLLRLRQACDHPYLVINSLRHAAESSNGKDKIMSKFLEGVSSQQFVQELMSEAESGKLEKTRVCPICMDVIDDAVALKECGHPACRGCMTEWIRRSHRCPNCRIESAVSSIITLPRNESDVDMKSRWRPSAKIRELMKDLAERRETRERDRKAIGKTVVFSQFTSMLDLVELAFEKDKVKWLRIDGSVPQPKRARILKQFEEEDEMDSDSAEVMLVSLRAGGVGLNLVSAAFAVLLDIHWNPQVDLQAQDRIHRHGQTRDVVIKRYIMEDSVEERLIRVQKWKQTIADSALGPPTDEEKQETRLQELKLLFST